MLHHARRAASLAAAAGALATAGALTSGCSLIFHADASQCSTDGDCQARGGLSQKWVCQQGTCQTVDAGGPDAGGCMTNADCGNSGVGAAVACDVSTHQCLTLTSPECQYIINQDGLASTSAPPIFVGAFIVVPPNAPQSHPSYINFNLALQEFTSTAAGIPAGPGTGHRTPVAVACDVGQTSDGITRAITHLVNDVHVPIIVSALATGQLAAQFNQINAQGMPPVFFMNAFDANSVLTPPVLTTNGLLWSMLGQPGDVAPAYEGFFPLLEAHIRNAMPWSLGPTAPMKVAFVTSAATDLTDMQQAVETSVSWNGMTKVQNDLAGNSQEFAISDSTLNGTDPAKVPNLQNVADAIVTFQPHVIVSFSSEEFSILQQYIEYTWNSAAPLPFYLLGPYNQASSFITTNVAQFNNTSGGGFRTLRQRIAGVGVASTDDPTALQVLSSYKSRYIQFAKQSNPDTNEENYYDAMYYAIYSLVAAGRISGITGNDVAQGMRNLIVPSSTHYSVGPGDMGNVFGALQSTSAYLTGTLGPPTFRTATGARVGAGSVYCINAANDAGTYTYADDVLRVSPSFDPDAGVAPDASALTGTFPCYPGIQ
jgi:hypothetical protein